MILLIKLRQVREEEVYVRVCVCEREKERENFFGQEIFFHMCMYVVYPKYMKDILHVYIL